MHSRAEIVFPHDDKSNFDSIIHRNINSYMGIDVCCFFIVLFFCFLLDIDIL